MREKVLQLQNRHERLGNFFRDGPLPRGESARENGDGDLGKRKTHANKFIASFLSVQIPGKVLKPFRVTNPDNYQALTIRDYFHPVF